MYDDPFIIKAKLWKYSGKAAWHFVTIDKITSKKIKAESIIKKGFGSIPVEVSINKTEWKTSIFPDKDEYLLPIKKSVRMAENIEEGDRVKITLYII